MSFILVKRDAGFRDLGVFTGRMQLVDSKYEFWPGCPMVMGEAEISEHVEHAFIFSHPWPAWLWADRLIPDSGFRLKTIEFMSWDVRPQGELYLGEIRPWRTIERHHRLAKDHQAEKRDAA